MEPLAASVALLAHIQRSINMSFSLPLDHKRYHQEFMTHRRAVREIALRRHDLDLDLNLELDRSTFGDFEHTIQQLTRYLPPRTEGYYKWHDLIKLNLAWWRVKSLTKSLRQQRVDIETGFQTLLLQQQTTSQRQLERRFQHLEFIIERFFSDVQTLSNLQE